MNEKKLSTSEMSAELEISRSSVSMLRVYLATPSLKLALKIADITNGQVPANSWPLDKADLKVRRAAYLKEREEKKALTP